MDSPALGTELDQRLGCLGSGTAEQCATRVSDSAGECQPALPVHGRQARPTPRSTPFSSFISSLLIRQAALSNWEQVPITGRTDGPSAAGSYDVVVIGEARPT